MVELRRTVRFAIAPDGTSRGGRNGYGGKPPVRSLGHTGELEVICRGEPDPGTGYLIDIKRIDDAVRATFVPALGRLYRDRAESEPAAVFPGLLAGLERALGSIYAGAVWRLTPAQSVRVEKDMTTPDPDRVRLSLRFDLAAAHRLHVPSLSDEQNRELFGKCNNPAGHGHNYRVEVRVGLRTDAPPGAWSDTIERVVEETIIDPFDHKHLNEDTREFAAEGGLTPTVENIARVFYERLAPAIAGEGDAMSLSSVRVWETDRTSATYPG